MRAGGTPWTSTAAKNTWCTATHRGSHATAKWPAALKARVFPAGCEQDQAAAVPLIFAAAEQGHRGARGRIFALVAGDGQQAVESNGQWFTDASRQSLLER